MLTLGSTVLGVNDVARATAFWHAALGYVPREPGDETWITMVPASGPGAQLALMLSETPAQDHPRIHLDLYADNQEAEADRLISLGASRVRPGAAAPFGGRTTAAPPAVVRFRA